MPAEAWYAGTMKQFLIASKDLSVIDSPPVIVEAADAEKALETYLREVRAHDEEFKAFVLNRGNVSFLATFLNATGVAGTEPEIVHSRVRKFFSPHPALAESYIQYMTTEEENVVTSAVFEFLALAETPGEHGMVAIALDSIPIITQSK
jgi:hypothetical protein